MVHSESQTTNAVLMVRPVHFGTNPETAPSNAFQNALPGETNTPSLQTLRQQAASEFDGFVELLTNAGVRVYLADAENSPSPDAHFPNNWFSTHADGTVVLYPMLSPVRRTERRKEVLERAAKSLGLRIAQVHDWSAHEVDGRYLEGTGSLVLDRSARVAYACRSPRTDEGLVRAWAQAFGYTPIVFDAADAAGQAIYHTNVLMHVGVKMAVLCLDAVTPADRAPLRESLETSGKTLLPITLPQMERFAGNMLELHSASGENATQTEPITVCSAQAWTALRPDQQAMLQAQGAVLTPRLDAIEALGGGSARCMLGELFWPSNS
jgi:hypothetical protein